MTERSRALAAAAAAACLALAAGAPLVGRGGLWADEAVHGLLAAQLAVGRPVSFEHAAWGMKDSYQGALKSYALLPAFKLFGPGPAPLRWTTLALGAAAAGAAALLGATLYGAAAGAFLGALVALDPAHVLGSTYDTAPAVLSILLKLAAFLCLAAARRERSARAWLFAAGALLGLTVWDKTHSLGLLAALPVAAALAHWKELRRRVSLRDAAALAAGAAAGAAPFLVFNAFHGLATFRSPEHMGWELGGHLRSLPGWLAARWPMLLDGLSGRWIYGTVSGASPSPAGAGGRSLLLLGAPLLAAAAARRDLAALRSCAFWLALTALVFAAACVSPVPVKAHHFYVCWPFPQLAFAALLAPALARARKPAARGALAAVLLVPLALHARALRAFAADMDRTGGSRAFYRGLDDLARWAEKELAARPGLLLRDDGSANLENSLALALGGRTEVFGERLPSERVARACRKGESAREVLVLRRSYEELGWRGASAEPEVELGAPAALFRYSDGESWARAYNARACAPIGAVSPDGDAFAALPAAPSPDGGGGLPPGTSPRTREPARAEPRAPAAPAAPGARRKVRRLGAPGHTLRW